MGGLVLIVWHELDEALAFPARSLDCLDIDAGLTQNTAETSQRARRVLHRHFELNGHYVVASLLSRALASAFCGQDVRPTSSASAFCNQYVIPISRYIVVAVVRCSCARSRWPVRRESLPRPR